MFASLFLFLEIVIVIDSLNKENKKIKENQKKIKIDL
jgi:hypothetical protein